MKKLVYYLIYGDDNRFYDMLIISLKSLIINGLYNDDILIISDNKNININIYDKIINELPYIKKHLSVVNINMNEFIGSKELYKFYIYEYDKVNNYDVLLYIDVDIIIVNNINFIFEKSDNKFSFSMEKILTIYGCWTGFGLLTDEEKEKIDKTEYINSGLFMFKPNSINLNICKTIFNSKYDEDCQEQPYVNKIFLPDKKKYNSNLTEYVFFNHKYQFFYYQIINTDIVFIHNIGIRHMNDYKNKSELLLNYNYNNYNIFNIINSSQLTYDVNMKKYYGIKSWINWELNRCYITVNKQAKITLLIFNYNKKTKYFRNEYENIKQLSPNIKYWFKQFIKFTDFILVKIIIDDILVDKYIEYKKL
jgi:hypothetical protein